VVGDSATVGTVNRSSGEFKSVDETSAFNLQQGAMMHWVGNGPDEEITYNDWENGRVVARAVHPTTGARRTIDGAIAAVSPDRNTREWAWTSLGWPTADRWSATPTTSIRLRSTRSRRTTDCSYSTSTVVVPGWSSPSLRSSERATTR